MSKFLVHDLGRRTRGETIEVTLSGSAANVQLLDSSNLRNYKSGRRYRYTGGLAKKSPVHLTVPRNGHWYVTVDLNGLRSTRVKSEVRVLPGALPPIRNRPLSSVPSLLREPDDLTLPSTSAAEGPFDVFISHASEDKDSVARPLANSLKDAGLRVWYDEFTPRIGDSLRRGIDRGIATSRFGVVIVSPSFLSRGWTNYELDGLVTRGVAGEQTLLPIWHNITSAEVMSYSPTLADKLARSTATYTIEDIANEIADLISGDGGQAID